MSTVQRILTVLLVLSGTSSAQILRVKAGAPPGGNGSSWAQAIDDLQVALALASGHPGTEIWLASGTYKPHGNDPTVSFHLPDRLEVYGGFAGTETSREQRDPQANVAILDGDLNGDDLPGFVNYADNTLHVVAARRLDAVTLDGFTVRGGNLGGGAALSLSARDVRLANLILRENLAFGNGSHGAGIWAQADTLTAVNCRFLDNECTTGGGVFLDDGLPDGVREALFIGCSFERNTATTGAGIHVKERQDWSLTLERCSFVDGFATTGAGVNLFGGNRMVARDCTFLRNNACSGGGINLFDDIQALVERCRFERNGFRTSCGVGTGGGGIKLFGTLLEVANSTFVADDRSSLWVDSGGNATVVGSTFFNNRTAALTVADGSLRLDHCIAWGSVQTQLAVGASGSAAASYSNVRMGGTVLPGTGNLEADPILVAPGTGDVHLAAGSPCIDAGDPALVVVGADFERDSRLLDGDLDGTVRLDIGADEHALLHLEVLSTLGQGPLTVVSSGPPGLAALLLLGRPGVSFLPFAGTVFMEPDAFVTPWPATPSSVSVAVPPGLSGSFHAQELAFDGNGAFLLSNFVPLEL